MQALPVYENTRGLILRSIRDIIGFISFVENSIYCFCCSEYQYKWMLDFPAFPLYQLKLITKKDNKLNWLVTLYLETFMSIVKLQSGKGLMSAIVMLLYDFYKNQLFWTNKYNKHVIALNYTIIYSINLECLVFYKKGNLDVLSIFIAKLINVGLAGIVYLLKTVQ